LIEPANWKTQEVNFDQTQPFLEKWHGAGNDFLVAVRTRGDARLDAETARRWCDRHTGLGADGVLEGTFTATGLVMRLRNADGSTAELSGNGLRCLAAAVVRRGLVPEGSFEVATDGGPRRVTVALDPSGSRAWGSVEMGEVSVEPGDSLESGVRAFVGNPHVVTVDRGGSDAELVELATKLAADAPEGTNVEFVTVIHEAHLSIRVVERGAGLTLACGTGSCATVAVTHDLGITAPRVTVTNQGGDLLVELDGVNATLSGPAVRIAEITLEEAW
jgi:diaminopimelate epimerase